VWGVTEDAFYALHLWRQRVEFPVLKAKLIELAAEWKPNHILIEDKASGRSLIQELHVNTTRPIEPNKVQNGFLALPGAATVGAKNCPGS